MGGRRSAVPCYPLNTMKELMDQKRRQAIRMSLALVVIAALPLGKGVQAQNTWERVSLATEDGFHGVVFADDQKGWAFTYGTGAIWHTTDGGTSWIKQAQLDSVYFETLQFVDSQKGWISGEHGLVYRTADGGNTWELNAIPWASVPPVPFRESGRMVLTYGMHFFSSLQGILTAGRVSFDRTTRTRKRNYAIWHTLDSGRTWNSNTATDALFFMDIVFPSASVGFAGNNQGAIYKTEDNGVTWFPVYEGVGQVRGVYFVDAKRGWACTWKGDVLATHNAGADWQTATVTPNRLRDILFIDEHSGFVVGDANEVPQTLFETQDGGVTWDAVSGIAVDLHRLAQTRTHVWAVGKEGTLLRKAKP